MRNLLNAGDEDVVSILENALPVEPIIFDSGPVWRAVRRRRAVRRIGTGGIGVASLAAALIVVNGFGSPSPQNAVAQSPSASPTAHSEATPWEAPAWEASLLPFAERLLVVGPDYADFGGVRYVAEPLGIVVFWKGEPPEEVTSIADEAEAAGIDVVFDNIPWNPSELGVLINTLVDALSADGVGVSMAAITEGFDGIQLAGPTLSTDPSAQERARALAREVIGDIPLTFVLGPVTTIDAGGA